MIASIDACHAGAERTSLGGAHPDPQGAPSAPPTFLRARPPAMYGRNAQPREPRSLYMTALESTLLTGTPDSIAQALAHASRRGKFNDPGFAAEVVDTLARRTDAHAFTCLQQAAARICLLQPAAQLLKPHCEQLDAARRANKRGLACALGLTQPDVIDDDAWRWFEQHAPEVGRIILQERPDLDAGVPFDACLHLYVPERVEPWQSPGEVVRQAMERFPHRADDLAVYLGRGKRMSGVWEWALSHAPLPHSESFWASALRREPELVLASIATRPEAVDRGLLAQAVRLEKNRVLEAACQANPKAINEPDAYDWTPLKWVETRMPASSEQFDIMMRYVGPGCSPMPPAREKEFAAVRFGDIPKALKRMLPFLRR